MAFYNGKNRGRSEILSLVGHPHQVARARRSVLLGGKANGVEAIEVDTGGGVRFTVLPGRGMDIADASMGGFPLAFMSATGITSPAYYEEPGTRWTRSFFGGLLTTCGIANAGAPGPDEEEEFGLHGRVSNAGAEDVCVTHRWEGDEYLIEVSGMVRESAAMAENLVLGRTIQTSLGRRGFTLTDSIRNEGFEPQPLMMLYHCNFGWPLLSPEARIIAPLVATEARDEIAAAQEGEATALRFHEPRQGYQEKVYFHRLASDEEGRTFVSLVTPDRGDRRPLGIVMRYSTRELGYLTEWKMLRKGFYVVGLEPGTIVPVGRGALRKSGDLPVIGGQEGYRITIDYEFVDTEAEIADLEEAASTLSPPA